MRSLGEPRTMTGHKWVQGWNIDVAELKIIDENFVGSV